MIKRLLPAIVFLGTISGAALVRAEVVALSNLTPNLAAGSATAQLSGVKVTAAGVSGASIFDADLTVADFSFAPLSSSQPTLGYETQSKFSIGFDLPVKGLLTYVVFFRGTFAGPSTVVYSFDHPFTIVSGLSGAIKVGNVLVVGNSGFFSGIIRFDETLTSLNLDTNATSTSQQAVTFAVNDVPPTVSSKSTFHVSTKSKAAVIKGTAFAPLGIRKVEARPPGRGFQMAKGRESWTYRVTLKARRTTVFVRATSGSSKVSALKRVVIVQG